MTSKKNLIEEELQQYVKDFNYTKISSKKLLTTNRLDIAFKLCFLENLEKNKTFAESIYKEHLRILSLGKFQEPGKPKKNSYKKYYDSFIKINEKIIKNGFCPKTSIIPISNSNSILNGSHRTSSAIFNKKDVYCLRLSDVKSHSYDYNFFLNRGVNKLMLEYSIKKFIKYSDNTYVAFLWPVAKNKTEKVKKLLGNILYEKDVSFTFNGSKNIICEIYRKEKWLGTPKNEFKGALNKSSRCFNGNFKVKVFFFCDDTLTSVINKKKQIRELFNLGKNSIHITDTKEEAERISNLLLNPNGIDFINHAIPYKYLDTINSFNQQIQGNSKKKHIIKSKKYIETLYGIKDHNRNSTFTNDFYINERIDPKFYFDYNGNEILGIRFLTSFGKQKLDPKSLKIIKLIQNQSYKEYFLDKVKSKFYFNYSILRSYLLNILKMLGIYKIVKFFYR